MGVARRKARSHEFASLAGIGCASLLGRMRWGLFEPDRGIRELIVLDGNLARNAGSAGKSAGRESSTTKLRHEGMGRRAGGSDKPARITSVYSLSASLAGNDDQ